MSVLMQLFSGSAATLFFVYLGLLALGVNLMPAWLGSRSTLAVAGAMIIAGGSGMF